MALSLILAIAIAIVSTVFALQNTTPVTVTFLQWRFSGSLAMIVILSLAAGVVICALALLPSLLKRSWTISSLRSKLAERSEILEPERDSEEGEPEGSSAP